MRVWLARLYEDAAAGRLGPTNHPLFGWFMELVHILIVLVRETVRDRLHVRAAMLAYWTAVAIVPIMVLGFAMTGPMGLGEQSRTAVRRLLYNTILANSINEVGGAIDHLLEAANLGTLGILGVVGIMIIGVQLYFNAELAYNDIFGLRVRRSWILRFTLFYAAITLGPLALASGFVLTARLGASAESLGITIVLPVLLNASVLVMAIRLLPCTDVSWKAALSGGLVSAFLFESAKLGFGAYIDLLGTRDNLTRLYGSVALMPVFLLWTYVLWMILLFGVEIAFLVTNHGSLLEAQRRLAVDRSAGRRSPDGFFAVGVMAVVCQHFLAGRGAMSPREIIEATGADPRHIHLCLNVLEDAGLVVESEHASFLPARPPAQIPASEVLRAWRNHAAPEAYGPAAGAIRVVLSAVDVALAGNLDILAQTRRTRERLSQRN